MFHKPENKSSTWVRGTILAAGLVLVVALGQFLFQSSAVHAQLKSWKLIPTPEPYTELYFDNTLSLPTAITSKPISFTFAIKNVQGQTMSYPYTITIVSATGTITPVKHGTIVLPDGGISNYYENITLPVGTKTSEISVELPDQSQEIHFWLGATQ